MFSYLGSKSQLVDLYPPPQHGTIVEPFCGSARYSLKWYDRQIILNDSYKPIADTWQWLISATIKDIDSLPFIDFGQDTRDLAQLSDIERTVISWGLRTGGTRPAWKLYKWGGDTSRGRKGEQIRYRQRMRFYCPRIKHWKVYCHTFDNSRNFKATWFIDPPYQSGGQHYSHGNKRVDYQDLAAWCKRRHGQVIVCESNAADWLPFRPLDNKLRHCTGNWRQELVWTK
jgi:site-specific DNA-adenine methylase